MKDWRQSNIFVYDEIMMMMNEMNQAKGSSKSKRKEHEEYTIYIFQKYTKCFFCIEFSFHLKFTKYTRLSESL